MNINSLFLALLPALVNSAGPPIINYTHTSISGDCVMYRSSSTNEYLEVASSSMLNTDHKPIEIRNFSGNGDQKLRRPSVNSSTVYDSLFHEDLFLSIFSPGKAQPSFIVSRSKIRKIELTVKNTNKSFKIIAANLSYFWGADKLPPTSEHEDRCTAQISDFPHIAPFDFISATGKRLTHFAWSCPAGRVCCAWECCDEHRRDVNWWALLALIPIGALLLCGSLCYKCCKKVNFDGPANRNEDELLYQWKIERRNKDPSKDPLNKTLLKRSTSDNQLTLLNID